MPSTPHRLDTVAGPSATAGPHRRFVSRRRLSPLRLPLEFARITWTVTENVERVVLRTAGYCTPQVFCPAFSAHNASPCEHSTRLGDPLRSQS